MNENSKEMGAMRFVYIYGKEHGMAPIDEIQYKQIKQILYGNKANKA